MKAALIVLVVLLVIYGIGIAVGMAKSAPLKVAMWWPLWVVVWLFGGGIQ